MNKYRVLKTYPKQITNSGRMLTLKEAKHVYLKKEPQVLRLIKMGILKPVVEIQKRPKPAKPKPKAEQEESNQENSENKSSKNKRRSDYLNKKNKSGNSEE